MSRPTPEKKIIVYDATYGFGPTFYVAEAEIGNKMVKVHSCSRRLSNFRYAIATKELAAEAKAIMAERDKLNERARLFKNKLDNLQPKP